MQARTLRGAEAERPCSWSISGTSAEPGGQLVDGAGVLLSLAPASGPLLLKGP